jgi:hypothetical protein
LLCGQDFGGKVGSGARRGGAVRANGITVYLLNGGLHAQQMAAHESARTTKLYDRRDDLVTLDQVKRIVL